MQTAITRVDEGLRRETVPSPDALAEAGSYLALLKTCQCLLELNLHAVCLFHLASMADRQLMSQYDASFIGADPGSGFTIPKTEPEMPVTCCSMQQEGGTELMTDRSCESFWSWSCVRFYCICVYLRCRLVKAIADHPFLATLDISKTSLCGKGARQTGCVLASVKTIH